MGLFIHGVSDGRGDVTGLDGSGLAGEFESEINRVTGGVGQRLEDLLVFLRVPFLLGFLGPLLLARLDLVTPDSVEESLGVQVAGQGSFELGVGLGRQGPEALEVHSLGGSAIEHQGDFTLAESGGLSEEEERAQDVIVVGQGLVEGLSITALNEFELQTEGLFAEVPLALFGLLDHGDLLGLAEKSSGGEVVDLANSGEGNNRVLGNLEFPVGDLPGGLDLAGLVFGLNGEFSGEGDGDLHVDTGGGVRAGERSLNKETAGHPGDGYGHQRAFDLSVKGSPAPASLDAGLDGDEDAVVVDPRVGKTHSRGDASEGVQHGHVLVVVNLKFARVFAEALLDELLLDQRVDGGGVDGVETLVVVKEVPVDVKLGLAGGAGLDLKVIGDLLQLGAGDGSLFLVVQTHAGFAQQTIDELLSVAGVDGPVDELGEPGTSTDRQAVVVVRGDEGLVAGEVDGVENVAKTGLLLKTGLVVVHRDVRSPEEGLHQGQDRFGLQGLFTINGILVGDLAGDGGVDEVGDLVIGLVPGAQGNAGPESLGRVVDEQKSEGSQTDLGLFSLVEVDGHQKAGDNLLLLLGQVGQGEDSLGADDVAESLIFPILSSLDESTLGPDLILFKSGFNLLLGERFLGFDPLLPHLSLGKVDEIALVVLVPFVFVVRARLAAGNVGLDVGDDHFVTNVTQGSEESHALSGVRGDLDLLSQEGNQHAGNDRVAGAAELTHNQLGEHVQALGGVDASLVDQARQGESGGDLELLVAHNDVRLQEFVEAGQELLGGGLDGGDEGGDDLDGPFTADLALEDELTNNHQSGVGAGQHQCIGDDLVGGAPFLVFPDLVDESVQLGVVERGEDSAEHVDLVGNVLVGGLVVVVLALEVSDDFSPETLGLLLEDLSVDFHDHRGVDATESRLAHKGTVGFVVIIVRVSEGLVDVGVGGDAGNELGGASGSGRLQVEVLDGQTFGGFGLVAEGLGDELVNGVDALDDEVALIGSATNDPDVLNVLWGISQ